MNALMTDYKRLFVNRIMNYTRKALNQCPKSVPCRNGWQHYTAITNDKKYREFQIAREDWEHRD